MYEIEMVTIFTTMADGSLMAVRGRVVKWCDAHNGEWDDEFIDGSWQYVNDTYCGREREPDGRCVAESPPQHFETWPGAEPEKVVSS